MDFGTWEGLTWPQIVALDPTLAERPANVPRYYAPAGGETFERVCARVAAALEDIGERMTAGGSALVVTHAGPLHALLRTLLGEAQAAALGVRFVPASITRIAIEPSGARIIELNRPV